VDEPVGYGKPPKNHQFKAGQSGNPRGRPSGAAGERKVIEKIAYEVHVVSEGARKKRLSTVELLLVALRNLAMDGDLRAIALMYEVYPTGKPQQGGKLWVSTIPPMEEF
jgi:hypothetical protein